MFQQSSKSYSDSALAALGLQVRREPSELLLPVLGILGVGLLAGAGLGLLLAPRKGQELREELGRGMQRTLHGVADGLRKVQRIAPWNHDEGDREREHSSRASDYENSRDRFLSHEGPRAPVFGPLRSGEQSRDESATR